MRNIYTTCQTFTTYKTSGTSRNHHTLEPMMGLDGSRHGNPTPAGSLRPIRRALGSHNRHEHIGQSASRGVCLPPEGRRHLLPPERRRHLLPPKKRRHSLPPVGRQTALPPEDALALFAAQGASALVTGQVASALVATQWRWHALPLEKRLRVF